MRTVSENPNWRPKDFSVLEILCPEPENRKTRLNSLSASFCLHRKILLEEADKTPLTLDKINNN